MTSMPLTIPLCSILRIESIEMWPKRMCQTSSEALAVIERVTLADSGVPTTVIYALSEMTIVMGSLYRPSSSSAMAINLFDEPYIQHDLLANCTRAPMDVS